MKRLIIKLLNLLPQTCWANLVMWSQGYPNYFKRIFKQECRKGKEGYPHAYCGKCEVTGRF
jgi:hypothetical protein